MVGVKQRVSKVAVFATVLLVGCVSILSPVSAAGLEIGGEGAGTIGVSVQPTNISAIVPTKVPVNVDPNKAVIDYDGLTATDATDTFMAPVCTVTSMCNAPLKLSVVSIEAQSGSPTVVTDTKFDADGWRNLSKNESAENIAFGYRMKSDTEWKNVITQDGWYNPGTEHEFGIIGRHSVVNIELKAKYGLTFEEAKDFNYNVVYKIGLE